MATHSFSQSSISSSIMQRKRLGLASLFSSPVLPWPSRRASSSRKQEDTAAGDQERPHGGISGCHLELNPIDSVIIGGLRSDRLFFEPGGATRSIADAGVALVGGSAVAVESGDPYVDFRRSMEEMVVARGAGEVDSGWLEGMLGCYLRVNGRKNHGLIVLAFVDLLLSLASIRAAAASSSS